MADALFTLDQLKALLEANTPQSLQEASGIVAAIRDSMQDDDLGGDPEIIAALAEFDRLTGAANPV